VAHALDAKAPDAPGLPAEAAALAKEIAAALGSAKRPLVVTGVSLGSRAVIEAAANVAWALGRAGRQADLACVFPECDSVGLAMFEAPSWEAAAALVQAGDAPTIVVLENDLFRHAPPDAVHWLLGAAQHVVVLDHLGTATAERAEVVLPAATFAEGDGTLVNHEGRAQRFVQVFVPEGEIQESWRWLDDLARALGREDAGFERVQDVGAALARELPAFRNLPQAAPEAELALAGVRIPRASHRFSGRTAMTAHRSMHEPKPPADPDSAFSFSMEGYEGKMPAALAARFWSPGWNSIQALNRFQEEIGGPLRDGDPGVRLLEAGAGGAPAYFAPAPRGERRAGELLAVAMHRIFGSEELSALAPGVAALAPAGFVALSPEDAAVLALRDGDDAAIALDGVKASLPVRVTPGLAAGLAGLPQGLAGVPVLDSPAPVQVAAR
jgi:NADH-quinone oxidoreductase subunit G